MFRNFAGYCNMHSPFLQIFPSRRPVYCMEKSVKFAQSTPISVGRASE